MPRDINLSQEMKDLLLADHRQFSELFMRNEQMGETRVNWLIGIVTAVAGGLVALATKEGPKIGAEVMRWIVVAAVVSLLVFGLLTLLRMIKRNASTDGQKRALDIIRQTFQDHLDPNMVLDGYAPFAPGRPEKKKNEGKERTVRSELKDVRKIGGLAHFVSGINAVLFAALIVALFYDVTATRQNYVLLFALALISLVATFGVQLAFVTAREMRDTRDLYRTDPTHAGGVVFRVDGDCSLKYLIVRPANNDEEWVLPKGKLKKGELHRDAALREVVEETGVVARPVALVGRVKYQLNTEVRVKFYLMEALLEATPREARKHAWVSFGDALNMLTHEGSRQMLELAEGLRRS